MTTSVITRAAKVKPDQQATPQQGGDHRHNPEVLEKPIRRRFTAEYKLRILREADACSQPGDIGKLLRREGLYSSHLTTWRCQRDRGSLNGLKAKKRGRKASKRNPLLPEVKQLRKQNQQLTKQLKQAELIIEVQKKVSQLLGIPLQPQDKSEDD